MVSWRIVAHGRLTPDEALQAARETRAYVSLMRSGYLSAVATPVAFFFLYRQVRSGEAVELPLIMISFFCAIGLVVPVILPMWMAKQAPPSPILFDLSEAACKITTAWHTRVSSWDSFESFDDRPEGIWVYREKVIGVYIPKRLMSAEDSQALLGFLGTRLRPQPAERYVQHTHLRALFWAAIVALGLFAYQTLQ